MSTDARRLLWVWAAVLGIGAAGYAFGRFSAPDRVEVREVVKVVEKEDTRAREQVIALTQQLETLKRHTRREETTLPDGTRHVVEETKTERTADTRTVTDATKESHTVKESTRETVKESLTVRSRPDWRVSGLVGVDLPTLTPTYGAQVDRRILGPLSLGLWGNSARQVGIAISMEF
jgi:uncharacterized protein HemX